MSATRYHCCDLRRRNAVAAHPVLNGLEALEAIDRDLDTADPLRQRTLLLYFLKPIAGAGFSADNVEITGGERIVDPDVEWADVASAPPAAFTEPEEADTADVVAALPNPDNVLVVRVEIAGDYSTYTLKLVQGPLDSSPPTNFDPRMSSIEFSFKAECPSDFDCNVTHACDPIEREKPDIDYLARDYATLRRLMLDRLAQQVPQWTPDTVADLGVTLVELMAYVGDQLSYRQDAIATEAYLGTARRRVSVRRHAHLVDYEMHDGCNARAFVHLQLDEAVASLAVPKTGTRFLTRCERTTVGLASGSRELNEAMQQQPVVFEPMESATLYAEHNELHFYTWSDAECCLPKGATQATLLGEYPNLEVGDWLLFEEVLGPRTGQASDADPTHRQVVCLTSVTESIDPVPDTPLTVTEIEWAEADALTFPLCLSAVTDEDHGADAITDVSVARGNLLLVDHGATQSVEDLGTVPESRIFTLANQAGHCDAPATREVPARFRPELKLGPVTQAAVADSTSAYAATQSTLEGAVPQITLAGTFNGDADTWSVTRTLLNSDGSQRHFVVEVDHDDHTSLRFGDGSYGERPAAGTEFTAVYRIGNGIEGNVGAEAIAHIVGLDVDAIVAVRNPLPAQNGVEAESIESVRRRAPEAFRTQQRAVTPSDYTEVTERYSGVARASSRMRWTGSWHTMFVTVDREGGESLDTELRSELTTHLDGYRMAGHDIEFEEPLRVSLELELHVCVDSDYFRSDVRTGLLDLFSSGVRTNGELGLFHADNFSFGDIVYLSPLLAAAHDIPGVESVEVRKFGRQGSEDTQPLEDGRLTLSAREIARLDNNPNFPEHGVLTLELHGGK